MTEMLKSLTLVACLASLMHGAYAQECQLCNFEQTKFLNISDACYQQDLLVSEKFDECCPLADTSCKPVTSNEALCRYIETSGSYCNSTYCDSLDENDLLIITIDFPEVSSGSCCKTCQCYGDPNCVSFNGVADEWVLCDGRHWTADATLQCEVTEEMCKTQTDHLGNDCVWLNTENRYWPIGLYGSPCQPDWDPENLPVMNMYSADDFKLELVLGERGIINKAIITNDVGVYTLTSDDCDTMKGAKSWSAETLSGESTSIPSTWTWAQTSTIEKEWYIMDEKTGINAKFVCTKSEVDGKLGPPRINVQELLEPMTDYTVSRSNLDGVCYTDTINDKLGSTDNTDKVHKKCVALALNDDFLMAKAVCTKSLSEPQKVECLSGWCSHRAGPEMSVSKCLKAISTSASKTYCTAAAYASGLELGDDFKRFVFQCENTISEFSWDDAVNTYGSGRTATAQPTAASCVNDVSQYPKILEECSQGVTVEYLYGGTWKTSFVIPAARPPCNGTLYITGDDYPELFENPVRFKQCELDCESSSSCQRVSGADITMRYTNDMEEHNYQATIGDLVCVYNSDFPKSPLRETWCFDATNTKGMGNTTLCPCSETEEEC